MSLDIDLYMDIDVGKEKPHRVCLYESNITHNLGDMAEKARLYGMLWHPEKFGFKHASEMIDPLKKGIEDMESNSAEYKKLDTPNGCGTYEDFLPWLKELLAACEEYPAANIEVSI